MGPVNEQSASFLEIWTLTLPSCVQGEGGERGGVGVEGG